MIANPFYFVCLACAFTVPWSLPAEAAPQDEEMIQKYGPNPKLFQPKSIENAINTWRWQMEYSNQQQKLIQQLENKWNERVATYQSQLAAFREEMGEIGIPYPQDAHALESIDTAIRNAEANRLALDAELRRLKLQLKMAATANDEYSRRLQTDLETLQQKVEELKQSQAVVEQKYSAEHPEYRNRVALDAAEMRRLRMDIERKEKELKQFIESPVIGSAKELAMVESVTAAYHQQESKVSTFNEIQAKIGVLQPLETAQRLKNKIAHAEKMAETAQTRRFELELENTRYQALIDLTPYPAKETKEAKEK
ncbi:MAG: hypothetical protein P8J91_07425 [Pirellulaceae bacterium]|nr:hypothetical protein [Pirellulaceae bacterium]MDG2103564.1 hypothetical protein [Pirellulaceae bacterium]